MSISMSDQTIQTDFQNTSLIDFWVARNQEYPELSAEISFFLGCLLT